MEKKKNYTWKAREVQVIGREINGISRTNMTNHV